MAAFDYDVIVIGSGFGGSVAAMRAAEKGYRTAVIESGRRWADSDLPKTDWRLDTAPLTTYPVREIDGQIEVRV